MKAITEITSSQQTANVIRLAPYCRVSSDSEDQLHSFAAQIQYYTEYAAQSADIGNKLTGLRIERRKKLSEDENDELLDELKTLDQILEETEIGYSFDAGLFEQIVTDITVESNSKLTFRLLGGIRLTEEIFEKGRCKTA